MRSYYPLYVVHAPCCHMLTIWLGCSSPTLISIWTKSHIPLPLVFVGMRPEPAGANCHWSHHNFVAAESLLAPLPLSTSSLHHNAKNHVNEYGKSVMITDKITVQPALCHISWSLWNTGKKPRLWILRYHDVVYETAQNKTIYTFYFSGSQKRLLYFPSLFFDIIIMKERDEVRHWCDSKCKRNSEHPMTWLSSYTVLGLEQAKPIQTSLKMVRPH